MKKLYTLALAALVAASATAAPRQLKDAVNFKNGAVQSELKTVTESTITTLDRNLGGGDDEPSTGDVTPMTFEELTSTTFDFEYFNMLNGNTGICNASFYVDEYEDLNFKVDAQPYAGTFDYYCEYDETTGELAFYVMPITWADAAHTLAYVSQPFNGTTPVNSLTATVDAATGVIAFPENGGIGATKRPFDGSALGAVQGYFSAFKVISCVKPAGDYNVSIEANPCSPTNECTFTVTAGADVAKVLYGTFKGDQEAADYAGMVAKYYGANVVTPGEPVTVGFDNVIATTDYATIVVVSLDAEGNLQKSDAYHFLVVKDETDAYQTVATVEFADPFISVYYNYAFTNPEVELQESVTTPGLYRFVNPYKGHEMLVDNGTNFYFYIDASDREFVSVPFSPTGVDFMDGIAVLGSFNGALGYSKEQCETNKFAVPTIEGRTISFDYHTILVHEPGYNAPGSWGYIPAPEFEPIVLPDLTLAVSVTAGGNAVEGATVAADGVTATTAADGTATLVLAAETSYLAEVELTVTAGESTSTQTIKLNGANNEAAVALGTAGIGDIEAAAQAVEYFNLQGIRVDNPAAGSVVIKRQAGKTSKVVF